MESTGITLHVAISDQSRGGAALIVVKLDGRVVVEAQFTGGDQHSWKESTLEVARGEHRLEVEETHTGTTTAQSFVADGDRWIVVMFEGPRLAVHVFDREVGYM